MFNPKTSKVDLQDGTFHEENTTTEITSSATISSDAISFDTVSFDAAPSNVLCQNVACGLPCTRTSTNLRSTAETANPEFDTYAADSLSGGITMINKGMQFPLDVAQEISSEHSYSSSKVKEHGNNNKASQNAPFQETPVEEVSFELDFSPPSSPVIESVSVDHDPDYECSSQSSQTSSAPSLNEYEECFNTSDSKRLLLVYEDNLRELLKFCPKCGSPVISDKIEERENEGSQYSVSINCLNGCKFTWQTQPSLPGVKGEGNLALHAGLFFSGIQFSKFQQFASVINLKSIGKDCYHALRENYVFPVIDACWETEQNNLINTVKERGEPVTLAGDGR